MPKCFLVLLVCFTVAQLAVCDEIDFDRDMAPLLSRRCLSCHAGDNAEAKLDLSSKATTLAGGESGAALKPGDPAASLVWQRVAAGEMPEDEPLRDVEREMLKRWITEGAKWGTDPVDPFRFSTDSRAGYDWWSLQQLAEVRLPTVSDPNWAHNGIDRFVIAKLGDVGLAPSEPAPARQLVRRLYFDLTGLPPTLDDLEWFERHGSWERLVDELLASPHYGQRWARHWLDIVRFGESHGFEYNQPRNNFWWYRNWVIDALNVDLAYDEFARQQLAGDVLHPDDTTVWPATGFLVAGPHNTTKPSSKKMQMMMRHDELEDMVGAIGQTFLGLTVNCARCHDHKFDPVTQKEYYQLVATVVGVDHGERELPDAEAADARQQLAGVRADLKLLLDELKKKEDDKCDGADLDKLRAEVEELKESEKRLKQIRGPMMYTAISKQPPVVFRLRRGDVTRPAERVQPRGLRAVNASLAEFGLGDDSADEGRRRKLADWVAGNQNPLLARVIVNRLWHYHFGQGIVRTPSDFGFNGDRPSHPELLDYLAKELIRNKWHLKPLHRMIVTSATYRQSSRTRPDAVERDTDNRYVWRMSPRRLSAEEIRDAMLSVAGQLDDKHGGPGYRDMREYKFRGSHYYDPIDPVGADAVRRTVYRFSPRGAKRTILDTFDCPDPSVKAPKRTVTTTPLQALSLMNNRFVLRMADALAARVELQSDSSEEAIRQLYQLVYSRVPDDREVERAIQFVVEHDLAAFCRVIFNSNEFLYVR